MERLGIVIIGYKNAFGVQRLLKSLSKVDFLEDKDISLIFSIDYSGDDSVKKLAEHYCWTNGEKYIISHETNLGLKKHILSCGNYMEEYNLDAIAVFEDDIYVSPEMYSYMKEAVQFYKNDPRIAGIALYKHEYNINAKHPFVDFNDGGDTYFVQYAMSWGQIWMRKQWFDFREWYDTGKWEEMNEKKIPQNILQWKNSWLKYHIMYCIDKDLYFVYPREALSTNFSDVGVHNKNIMTSMQIPLCVHKKAKWEFSHLNETNAVYDAFFENVKLKDILHYDKLEIDLYGVKHYLDDTTYVLTRRILPYKVERSWGLYLRPIEANIFLDIPGNEIFLYNIMEKDNKVINKVVKNKLEDRYFEYDLKGINILCKENIRYCMKKVFRYFGIKFGIK